MKKKKVAPPGFEPGSPDPQSAPFAIGIVDLQKKKKNFGYDLWMQEYKKAKQFLSLSSQDYTTLQHGV